MSNNAIISICGEQFFTDADSDSIELITDGEFYTKDGSFYIRYKESELTGLSGVTTTIKIDENRMVTLLRTGSVTSQLVFETGRRHVSLYNTEDGYFTVAVNTSCIKNELQLTGGSLEVDYAIEINNALAGYNFFKVDVKGRSASVRLKS